MLGYWDFVEGLTRGFAAHHAGMLPTFREIVEELFTAGRIRAVFATETLALGINMPARTVVIEKLVKFNGETHADVTPAEYTQLTGRAGRRGIDIEGHAVVLWNRGMDVLAVAGLASTRTYPLRSSFRPTYNMAVNLVAQVGREVAREILETSFAQFQADRAVVGLARAVRKNEEGLEGYAEAMQCHLGDFTEYAALRNEIRRLEKEGAKHRAASKRAEAALSLEALRIGDVIRIPAGRRAGYAVVVQPSKSYRGEPPAPTVLTEDKQIRRLTLVDVPVPVEALTRVKVPTHFNAKSPKSRRDLATTLRIAVPHEPPPRKQAREAAEGEEGRIAELRRQMKAHPCHQCPEREDHARWAERWWRLKRETVGLQRKVEGRTNSVAKTFDRICTLLSEMGYLSRDSDKVTPQGEHLRRLYTEKDLLAAECLRLGLWKRLDPAELAAIVSTLVHEPRRDEVGPQSTAAHRRRGRGRRRDDPPVERARGPRARPRPTAHRRPGCRDGLGDAPLGERPAPRRGPARPGHGGRRLRPALQAGRRPAGADRRCGARAGAAGHGAQGRRCGDARRRGRRPPRLRSQMMSRAVSTRLKELVRP